MGKIVSLLKHVLYMDTIRWTALMDVSLPLYGELALTHLALCILYNQRDTTYTVFFILISALHILGGFSTHHQELIKT
jgi:hypothetical protein